MQEFPSACMQDLPMTSLPADSTGNLTEILKLPPAAEIGRLCDFESSTSSTE